MRKLETATDVERALRELMPVALSEQSQHEIGEMLEDLSGSESRGMGRKARMRRVLFGGAAAAALLVCGFTFFPVMIPEQARPVIASQSSNEAAGEMELLSESDRVEKVLDEGLFVDSGGSAVRKVRVRMVEESRFQDKETGIIVMLTEPREEMYMLPVSKF